MKRRVGVMMFVGMSGLAACSGGGDPPGASAPTVTVTSEVTVTGAVEVPAEQTVTETVEVEVAGEPVTETVEVEVTAEPVTETVTETVEVEVTAEPVTETVTETVEVEVTPDVAAEDAITNGVWTVGRDVKPGTYRTTEPVSSEYCYWAILVTGSNGQDIVANDIVEGGFPSVTLSEGQDFETSDCGTWARDN